MKQLYFDYAAATPMDPAVASVMQPYFSELFFNPSATYLAARGVHKDIETARGQVAHWLGARPGEIVFTAGGTEANNLALQGIMRQHPHANLLITAIEHPSILTQAKGLSFNGEEKSQFKVAPVDGEGVVDVDQLLALVDDATVLVSVIYANNEVGTIQPIRKISQALALIRAARLKAGNRLPLYLHTDAAQAAAYLDLHAARLGVDLLTINAGKIYGPKQVGALYVSSRVQLQPHILGGGQERGLRSGTENVAGIMGLATALDLVQQRRHEETRRLQEVQSLFFDLLEKHIPNVVINGSRKHRLPNNMHFTIPGADNERLLFQLDEAGILCAAGSACSASSDEPSHVLTAMGISDADAQASLRFTMGLHTTEAQVERAVTVLASLL